MFAFNEFVANTGLREIHRGGGQYTSYLDKQASQPNNGCSGQGFHEC